MWILSCRFYLVEVWYSLEQYIGLYCSREYQTSTRLNQQYEKSTLNVDFIVIALCYSNGIYILLCCGILVVYLSQESCFGTVENIEHIRNFTLLIKDMND